MTGTRSRSASSPPGTPWSRLPAFKKAAAASGALAGASGALTIYSARHSDNAAVRTTGTAAGATEIAGGAGYAIGARIGSAALQTFGRTLARVGGGAGMLILSGYAAVGDFKRGDVVSGIFDSAGALGGALILASPLAGPLAPLVLGAGVLLGAVSLGFTLGNFLGSVLWSGRNGST